MTVRAILRVWVGALLAGAPALLGQWSTSPMRVVDLDSGAEAFINRNACAIDQEGRFAVVYNDPVLVGEDLYSIEVTARFYGEDGTPVDPNLVLNGPQVWCCPNEGAIAFTRAGRGLAVWYAPGEPGVPLGSPYGRWVDAGGLLSGPADSLLTATTPLFGAARAEAVAARADSTFAVAWRDLGNPQAEYRVRAGSYSTEGVAEADPFVVTDHMRAIEYGLHPKVSVAGLPAGRLVVAWSDFESDGSGDGVLARIFERDGTPVTAELQVNSYTSGHQSFPDVAADAAGNFVVVWDSVGQDGSGLGVYGQRFDPSGAKVGPEFQVSSDAYSAQLDADVSVDHAGNFVVAFASTNEPAGYFYELWGRGYGADGEPRGELFWISPGLTGDYERPHVALSDAGVLVVSGTAWLYDYERTEAVVRQFALPCVSDATTLCLGGGRFLVRAFYDTAIGLTGAARALPLTADSGGFWFFSAENFELLVKVLDGCGINGNYWIYAAGLTDVEVDLIVTDTWTGRVRVYANPLATPFQPLQRVNDLATCAAPDPTPGDSSGWAGGGAPVQATAVNIPPATGSSSVAADRLPLEASPGAGDRVSLRPERSPASSRFGRSRKLHLRGIGQAEAPTPQRLEALRPFVFDRELPRRPPLRSEDRDAPDPLDSVQGSFREPAIRAGAAAGRAESGPGEAGPAATGESGCVDDATHLCLTGERFRVSATWRDFEGHQGAATAIPVGADSGLFWFFGPENVELAVKVLDGCAIDDHFWVYAAGLTNVEVEILVEDTASSETWSFTNPRGQPFPPVLDSAALAVCP